MVTPAALIPPPSVIVAQLAEANRHIKLLGRQLRISSDAHRKAEVQADGTGQRPAVASPAVADSN